MQKGHFGSIFCKKCNIYLILSIKERTHVNVYFVPRALINFSFLFQQRLATQKRKKSRSTKRKTMIMVVILRMMTRMKLKTTLVKIIMKIVMMMLIVLALMVLAIIMVMLLQNVKGSKQLKIATVPFHRLFLHLNEFFLLTLREKGSWFTIFG